MNFENQVFISYARLDNPAIANPPVEGWVTRLDARLRDVLAQELGRKAKVWRDNELRGNEEFSPEIKNQLPKTAVMLAVLSRRYLESRWCLQEVNEFCEAARKQPVGLQLGTKYRVFYVVTMPLPNQHSLPGIMSSGNNYLFYQEDDNGDHFELDPVVYGQTIEYNKAIKRLAIDIASMVDSLESAPATESPSPHIDTTEQAPAIPAANAKVEKDTRHTVYLAECSSDQESSRQALRDELLSHGYNVIPQDTMPRDDAAYAATAKELLQQCCLSIHLVGSKYRLASDEGERSIVAIQNEVAAQVSHERGLRRVIWLPRDTVATREEQKTFLQQLQTDSEAQFGADLISAPELETVKRQMHAVLESLDQPATPTRAADAKTKSVYLICIESDMEKMVDLAAYLDSKGITMQVPSFSGDAEAMRRENESLLLGSDGVIIYYGDGNESWRRAVEGEAIKIRLAAGLKFPVYNYIAEPKTGQKVLLAVKKEAHPLNCVNGFQEAAIEPFVDALAKGDA